MNNFLDEMAITGKSGDRKAVDEAGGPSEHHHSVHAGSSLHVYSECNVALLCEEVLSVINVSFARLAAHTSRQDLLLGDHSTGTNSPSLETSEQPPLLDLRVANHDWWFVSSPGALRRIILNLVGNSLKYTKSGSINIELDLQSAAVGSKLEQDRQSEDPVLLLTVTDTGQGMSADFLSKKLFVPFSQASNAASGAGLGLSLVDGIVKSLHGTIKVASTLGHGTSVTVEIPMHRPQNILRSPSTVEGSVLAELSSLDRRQKTFALLGSIPHRTAESLRIHMHQCFDLLEVMPTDRPFLTFVTANDLADIVGPLLESMHTVVLHRTAPTQDAPDSLASYRKSTHSVVMPCGPEKLAKIIQACVDKGSAPRDLSPRGSENPQFKGSMKRPSLQYQGRQKSHDVQTQTDEDSARSLARHPSIGEAMVMEDLPSLLQNVHLPSSPPPEGEALDRRWSRRASQAILQRKPGPYVLCVDDNSINLKLLQTYAEKAGLTNITTAVDGLEAFNAFHRNTEGFNVIFMDLTMPVCDGFESTAMIRKTENERARLTTDSSHSSPIARSVIIAFTGLASAADQEKAFAAGVDHFVTKPLRFKDFKKLLHTCGILEAD